MNEPGKISVVAAEDAFRKEASWDDPRSVLGRLLREGHCFDFFQAARLLSDFFSREVNGRQEPTWLEHRVRFRPHHELVFPATDVQDVEKVGEERVRITVSFMGLYGIDSPLPVYFYNEIAAGSEASMPLRDFLDMFNHRLYLLFYRSWKKYHPVLHYVHPGKDSDSQRALCLAGLGTRHALQEAMVPGMRLAALAGRLSCRVRNVGGLQSLISDFFQNLKITIIENVPRWVKIAERPHMGKGSGNPFMLGTTATIGSRIMDATGKFRIVLEPLQMAQFLAFLPQGQSARLLHFLVRLYAPDHLDYDVELRLLTADIPPLVCGDKNNRLSLTTWLGRPKGEMVSRIVAY